MSSIAESGLKEVVERMQSLLETGSYHDFVIDCESKDFKVHRSIICPASAFFDQLCNNELFKEGKEGRGSISDTRADIFEKGLQYIYTGNYEIPERQSEETNLGDDSSVILTLQNHVRMFLLADFLQVESLKQTALSECKQILDDAQSLCAPTLIETARMVLENTTHYDTALRAEMMRCCARHQVHLHSDELDAVLSQEEPLAWDLLKSAELRFHIEHLEHETLKNTHKRTCEERDLFRTQRSQMLAIAQQWEQCSKCCRHIAQGKVRLIEGAVYYQCNHCHKMHSPTSDTTGTGRT